MLLLLRRRKGRAGRGGGRLCALPVFGVGGRGCLVREGGAGGRPAAGEENGGGGRAALSGSGEVAVCWGEAGGRCGGRRLREQGRGGGGSGGRRAGLWGGPSDWVSRATEGKGQAAAAEQQQQEDGARGDLEEIHPARPGHEEHRP